MPLAHGRCSTPWCRAAIRVFHAQGFVSIWTRLARRGAPQAMHSAAAAALQRALLEGRRRTACAHVAILPYVATCAGSAITALHILSSCIAALAAPAPPCGEPVTRRSACSDHGQHVDGEWCARGERKLDLRRACMSGKVECIDAEYTICAVLCVPHWVPNMDECDAVNTTRPIGRAAGHL